MKKIITIILVIVSRTLFAQNDIVERHIFSQSSITANYIYVFGPAQYGSDDSIIMRSTKNFIITRYETKDDSISMTGKSKVFILDRVRKEADLNKFLSEEYIAEFIEVFDVKNRAGLLSFFDQNSQPKDYLFYFSNLGTKMTLGHVLKDETVEKGKSYVYAIKRVDLNDKEYDWGYTALRAGEENYLLKSLKPEVLSVNTFDSGIIYNWALPISEAKINAIQKPKISSSIDQIQIEFLPYFVTSSKARFYSYTDQGYVSSRLINSQTNNSGDTLFFTVDEITTPNQFKSAFISLEDEVGNTGIPSDTAFAYSVTKRFVPMLQGITASEIQDGIKISWDTLPNVPFISGVLLYRYDSDDKIDTLGIFKSKDTAFIDYKIKIGQTYRYKAKALYANGVNYEQEIPAEATGEYSKFTKPSIPSNLKAKTQGEGILLAWDSLSSPSIYGYYIYRGLSANNCTLIDGPIKHGSYLDTSAALSGRTSYFYRVMSQNYRQDTSELSDYVAIRPSIPVKINPPSNINFYYANNVLNLSWDDVMLNDGDAFGYFIERRMEGEKTFKRLNNSPLTLNKFEDIEIKEGNIAYYRVATVAKTNDIGEFSDELKFEHKLPKLAVVNNFTVANDELGLVINVPNIDIKDKKTFNIYKRSENEDEMKLVATLKDGIYFYTDANVKPGDLYVYTVTILFTDGTEGAQGFSVSRRRD